MTALRGKEPLSRFVMTLTGSRLLEQNVRIRDNLDAEALNDNLIEDKSKSSKCSQTGGTGLRCGGPRKTERREEGSTCRRLSRRMC